MLRRRVFLFAMCLVIAVSSVTSVLSPTSVSAAPIASGKDPNWLAASYWYSQAVSQCVDRVYNNPRVGGGPFNLDESSVKSGSWLVNTATLFQNESTGSYFARSFLGDIGDDGRQICAANDNELLGRAFEHWGVAPITAACDSGLFERANKTDCAQGNGDFQLKTDARSKKQIIDAYINNTVYGGRSPTLDGAAAYVYYRDTLLNGCAWGAQALTTRPANSINVYVVPSFKKDGKKLVTTETYYIGDKSPTTGVWTMTNPDADRTCGQLADLIKPGGAYANAYGEQVKQGNITDSTPSACLGSGSDSADCKKENTTTCAVDWIGWMVCGVSWAIAGFVGFAYKVMTFFLEIPPISTQTTKDNALYTAWSTMRNIANVVFVGLFIIMIYSQITGGGRK